MTKDAIPAFHYEAPEPGVDHPADTYTGPLKQIDVTTYRTEQTRRTCRWEVPADFTEEQIKEYISATIAYVGFDPWHISEAQVHWPITVDVHNEDEPEGGFDWKEVTP